jgi:ABC-type transport system substrate-binding protein
MTLVMTACGGDDDDSGDDATPDTTGDDTGINNDPTAILRASGPSTTPPNYDPVRGNAQPCDTTPLSIIYDTLVRIDESGLPVPGLAKSWTSPDPQTFEMELQEGVEFQDGTPFDAEAVKQHLDRAMTLPDSILASDVSAIESVEATGELTVVLHLNAPRAGILPTILSERAGMVPSPTAVAAAGEAYGGSDAVGAGPYKLDGGASVPTERMVTRAWDGYWDPDTQLLGGIELIGLQDRLATEKLLAGEFDYANVRDTDLDTAKNAGDAIELHVDPSPLYGEVFINFGKEPWDDVLVRQALEHALDREALTRALTTDVGTVAWSPTPPTSPAHDDAVEDLYPFDPEKAKELLAEAGYPDGITFDAVTTDRDFYQRQAVAVQDMIKASGFTVNIVTVPAAEVNNAIYVRKEFDASIIAHQGSNNPGLTLERKFSTTGAANPSGVGDEEIDRLLAEAAATTDIDEQTELYKQVEVLVMEQALAVPFLFQPAATITTSKVKGVTQGWTSCQWGNFLEPGIYIEQ